MEAALTEFCNVVFKSYKLKAFEDLINESERYSKGEHLVYGNLNMRNYLKATNLDSNQKKMIFKFRTRMINVKDNYRSAKYQV